MIVTGPAAGSAAWVIAFATSAVGVAAAVIVTGFCPGFVALAAGAGATGAGFVAIGAAGFGRTAFFVDSGGAAIAVVSTGVLAATGGSPASASSDGCRAVISAAAAMTHVMPTTIARQLYAFGGGTGGFATAADFV